jgi:hypothetical protein
MLAEEAGGIRGAAGGILRDSGVESFEYGGGATGGRQGTLGLNLSGRYGG